MASITQKERRFVGLDVHAATIAVAVADHDGEVRSLGTIPNRPDSVHRLAKKLNEGGPWKACYEAGPTGYALYWQLTKLGIACEVIAPTLVPMKAGDRVKTDRRDAERLARSYRAGELTAVWIPDAAHEALRDLVRAREAAKCDQLRARHRLGKFLLRQGRRPSEKIRAWTQRYIDWVKREVKFEEQAQQWTLEDYLNEVEHCSLRIARLEGLIDKAVESAPAEMREVVEAAWSQRFKPILSRVMKRRQANLSPEIQEIATKARNRLHQRYMTLLMKGKNKQQVVTAVARELLGFIWAVGVLVEGKRNRVAV